MSRFLQRLLQIDEPLFERSLLRLEQTAGRAGVDTRLIADITQKAHVAIRALGLDPADTTYDELYQALNASVRRGTAADILLNTDYVLFFIDQKLISFNLIDAIENMHHELPFGKRIYSHGQRSLRGEIIERYLQHSLTDETTTRQLALDAGLLVESDQWYSQTEKQAASQGTHTKKPYLLAIGDIVTDAFIKLREDKARIDVDERGNKRLSMEFGNKPPYDSVEIIQAVGNSANAAVSFARLGLDAGLMAYLGDDQPGRDSLQYLKGEHVDTQPVSVQKGFKSNYHYALRYGADRTILIKYEDYNYTWQEPARVPDFIYLSMISASAWQLHLDLLNYLEKHPTTKFVFQPGTFHFEWGAKKLAKVYRRSYVVVMNREEAALVTGKDVKSITGLMSGLHELGPEIVIVSDGPDGAYASDGSRILQIPNYPDPALPYDRTGAGDAFASTITAALASGETLDTALLWAPINSMSVVQKLGAQAGLLNQKEIEKYLEKAPEWYHPKELE